VTPSLPPVLADRFDSLLLLSFGGPERTDDVIPFLENVLRGKNVPRERMLEVAEHYFHFGGKSPINEQNRAFDRCAGTRAQRAGTGAARLLGEQELASNAHGYARSYAGGRHSPGAGLRDIGFRFLFRLSPVSGGHRAGEDQNRVRRAGDPQAADLSRPPGFHSCHGRSRSGSPGPDPGRPACGGAAPLHCAQYSRFHGRNESVRGTTPEVLWTRVASRGSTGRAGVPEPERSAHAALA